MINMFNNYIYNRAYNMAKYLIEKGLDPKEAIEITIDKYKGTKVNIEKLEKRIRKEIKKEFYIEEI